MFYRSFYRIYLRKPVFLRNYFLHYEGILSTISSKPLDSITALRGFLALYVMLHNVTNHFHKPLLTHFLNSAYLSVDFFFIISGFFLCYVYEDTFSSKKATVKQYSQFLLLRLARIYPVHVFLLIIFVILMVSITGFADFVYGNTKHPIDLYSLGTIFNHLLLVQSWTNERIGWIAPSWSLSNEWLLYLFFPIQIYSLRHLRNMQACLIRLTVHSFGYVVILTITGTLYVISGYPAILRAYLGFTSGIMLFPIFMMLTQMNIPQKIYNYLLLALTIVMIILLNVKLGGMRDVVAVIVAAMMILVCTLLHEGYLHRILVNKVTLYLGNISYSIYMVHWLTMMILGFYFANTSYFTPLVEWIIILCASFISAIVMYHAVETPLRTYIKNKLVAK